MITSTSNKRIKELSELQSKAKTRNAAGVFLVEGRKMFMEAPLNKMKAVYVEEHFLRKVLAEPMYADVKTRIEQIADRNGKKAEGQENCEIIYEIVTQEVFAKISDTKTPQGILCVVEQEQCSLEQLLCTRDGRKPLIMILEDIQDPGNLGTIIRTAEGAGVSGVIVTKNTVDRYNPKTIRATMGSIYRIPCMETSDLQQTMTMLKQAGVGIYAAHLKGTQYHDAFDYTNGTAFLIGNEGNGLKKETADAADTYIRIPMEGQVESLNAAIAATLLMYEANRQRRMSLDVKIK